MASATGHRHIRAHVTLKIPAMDKVRLEVRDTRRNSEKLRPKASKPPTLRTRKECSSGASSVTRNSLSEVLRLRPGGGTEERHAGNPQVCTQTRLESQKTREKLTTGTGTAHVIDNIEY